MAVMREERLSRDSSRCSTHVNRILMITGKEPGEMISPCGFG